MKCIINTLEHSQHPMNVKSLLELKIKLGNLWRKKEKKKKQTLFRAVKPNILPPAGRVPEPRASTALVEVAAPLSRLEAAPAAAAGVSAAPGRPAVSPALRPEVGEGVLEEMAALPGIPAEGAAGPSGIQRSARAADSGADKGEAARAGRPRLGRLGKAQPR